MYRGLEGGWKEHPGLLKQKSASELQVIKAEGDQWCFSGEGRVDLCGKGRAGCLTEGFEDPWNWQMSELACLSVFWDHFRICDTMGCSKAKEVTCEHKQQC